MAHKNNRVHKTFPGKTCRRIINFYDTAFLFFQNRKIIKNHNILATNGHNHTTASDGKLDSFRMLILNWLAGFRCVAVTDHNGLKWSRKEKTYAKYFPIIFNMRFLPGVEFSCFFDLGELGGERKEFHIVGTGVEPENAILKEAINTIQKGREHMTEKMLQKIREAGFVIISFEELKVKSGGNVTLPDIAENVRTKSGNKVNTEKFIREHLASGKDCYVKNDTLIPVKSAIEIIKRCGGIAIWAHPKDTLENLFDTHFENVALCLKDMGINGIEAFRNNHSAEEVRRIKIFCRENNLEIRAGSDMHTAKDLFAYVKNVTEVVRKDSTL